MDLVMCCITTTKISVLWNRKITNEFLPSRGIRQRDPLSSYIFVVCLDRLSTLIKQRVEEGSWKPLKVTQSIFLSHISFL